MLAVIYLCTISACDESHAFGHLPLDRFTNPEQCAIASQQLLATLPPPPPGTYAVIRCKAPDEI
jgi:hypothetical protein